MLEQANQASVTRTTNATGERVAFATARRGEGACRRPRRRDRDADDADRPTPDRHNQPRRQTPCMSSEPPVCTSVVILGPVSTLANANPPAASSMRSAQHRHRCVGQASSPKRAGFGQSIASARRAPSLPTAALACSNRSTVASGWLREVPRAPDPPPAMLHKPWLDRDRDATKAEFVDTPLSSSTKSSLGKANMSACPQSNLGGASRTPDGSRARSGHSGTGSVLCAKFFTNDAQRGHGCRASDNTDNSDNSRARARNPSTPARLARSCLRWPWIARPHTTA